MATTRKPATRTAKPAAAKPAKPAKPAPAPKVEEAKAPRNCGCGCNRPTITDRASFLPGHDARFAAG